jgi:hypothetical protein
MEISVQDLIDRLNDMTSDHSFEGDTDVGYENSTDCVCELCIAHNVLIEVWSDMEAEASA